MITNRRVRLNKPKLKPSISWIFAATEVLAVYQLSRASGWWWLGAAGVMLVELRGFLPGGPKPADGRLMALWERLPGIIMGLSTALIISLEPRGKSQLLVALLYAAWLAWREVKQSKLAVSWLSLLVVQAVMYEAIFLMAAIWQIGDGKILPAWFIMLLVWLGSYFSVFGALSLRKDRSAGVMAAAWAVVAAEISWVLLLWLITYTNSGAYIMVPQPALILTALAYIFGSVFVTSREGNLSRARLGEYMLIALILVAIVIAGTSWRGNT